MLFELTSFVQVLLDKMALDKEMQTLQNENQQLRSVLKQYLDGKWQSFDFTDYCQPPGRFALNLASLRLIFSLEIEKLETLTKEI